MSAHVQYGCARAPAGGKALLKEDVQGLPLLMYVSRSNEKTPAPRDRGERQMGGVGGEWGGVL